MLQVCWTFSFAQVQIGLSLAFMLAILLALAAVVAALGKHRAVVRLSSPEYDPPSLSILSTSKTRHALCQLQQ